MPSLRRYSFPHIVFGSRICRGICELKLNGKKNNTKRIHSRSYFSHLVKKWEGNTKCLSSKYTQMFTKSNISVSISHFITLPFDKKGSKHSLKGEATSRNYGNKDVSFNSITLQALCIQSSRQYCEQLPKLKSWYYVLKSIANYHGSTSCTCLFLDDILNEKKKFISRKMLVLATRPRKTLWLHSSFKMWTSSLV